MPPDVCTARTVVDRPEPRVMVEPGERVELDMMYWDRAFGVMVSERMVKAGRVAVATAERMEVLVS